MAQATSGNQSNSSLLGSVWNACSQGCQKVGKAICNHPKITAAAAAVVIGGVAAYYIPVKLSGVWANQGLASDVPCSCRHYLFSNIFNNRHYEVVTCIENISRFNAWFYPRNLKFMTYLFTHTGETARSVMERLL